MDRAAIACLVAIACGPHAPPQQPDFGSPPPPEDPIACPADRLEAFARRFGVPIEITAEQIVDSARTDLLPCKPSETDDACVSRARQRPAPQSYEVVGVAINGEDKRIEASYQVDGALVSEQFADVNAFVLKVKALQADGRRIVVIDTHTIADAPARHATITYRGIGGRQQRVGKMRWRPTNADETMAEVQAVEHIEIRSMTTENGDLLVTATCGL